MFHKEPSLGKAITLVCFFFWEAGGRGKPRLGLAERFRKYLGFGVLQVVQEALLAAG